MSLGEGFFDGWKLAIHPVPMLKKKLEDEGSAIYKNGGEPPRVASAPSRTPTSAHRCGVKILSTENPASNGASLATTYGSSPRWPHKNALSSKHASPLRPKPSKISPPPQRQDVPFYRFRKHKSAEKRSNYLVGAIANPSPKSKSRPSHETRSFGTGSK